jgi:Protein of unknown function (DUF2934)
MLPMKPVTADYSVEPFETTDEITAPTQEEIAAEAYLLYAVNGYQEGRDVDDWLAAEQALLDRRAQSISRTTSRR